MPEPPKSELGAAELLALAKQGMRSHAEFVGHFIEALEGPEGFAKELVRLYRQAPVPVQLSMMKFMLKQIDISTERGATDLDLDTCSDEELAMAFRQSMEGRHIDVRKPPKKKKVYGERDI